MRGLIDPKDEYGEVEEIYEDEGLEVRSVL